MRIQFEFQFISHFVYFLLGAIIFWNVISACRLVDGQIKPNSHFSFISVFDWMNIWILYENAHIKTKFQARQKTFRILIEGERDEKQIIFFFFWVENCISPSIAVLYLVSYVFPIIASNITRTLVNSYNISGDIRTRSILNGEVVGNALFCFNKVYTSHKMCPAQQKTLIFSTFGLLFVFILIWKIEVKLKENTTQ